VCDKKDGSPFNEDDAATATAIAQIASFAIQNAISYEKTRQAQAESRVLSNRLLHSQDEDRRRTAQFLHETTAQSLLILKMNMARASRHVQPSDAPLRELLSDSVDLVESAMQEIRTLSYLLHPPMLDEAGVAAALRWYGKGFSDRSGIYVHVEIADDFGRLPPRT
jgi:signal transduction histidine kinase